MDRVPVTSSTLSAASWFVDQLELEFRSGAVYRYFHVPKHVFSDLLAAKSKGQFFNANIRNCFTFQEVRGASHATRTVL